MRNKAQFFSTDLIIAVIIFTLLFVTIIWLWEYTQQKITLHEKKAEIEMPARIALSSLLQTSGIPSNWSNYSLTDFSSDNIYSIGLSQENNPWNLDSRKISKLSSLNITKYLEIKKILGLSNPNFEFYIQFSKWNGSAHNLYSSSGISVWTNSTFVTSIDRYALIDGEKSHISMKLWEKCTTPNCN